MRLAGGKTGIILAKQLCCVLPLLFELVPKTAVLEQPHLGEVQQVPRETPIK
jgi:hypothetical protein